MPGRVDAPTRIVSGRTGVRVKAVIPFGVGEAFVHRVHILGAELAQAHAGGGVGCLAMSGICYAMRTRPNPVELQSATFVKETTWRPGGSAWPTSARWVWR